MRFWRRDPNSVYLSAEQVEFAKMIGMPLVEYARIVSGAPRVEAIQEAVAKRFSVISSFGFGGNLTR